MNKCTLSEENMDKTIYLNMYPEKERDKSYINIPKNSSQQPDEGYEHFSLNGLWRDKPQHRKNDERGQYSQSAMFSWEALSNCCIKYSDKATETKTDSLMLDPALSTTEGQASRRNFEISYKWMLTLRNWQNSELEIWFLYLKCLVKPYKYNTEYDYWM